MSLFERTGAAAATGSKHEAESGVFAQIGRQKTGYGAFEFATPKKGYGAFFLIGLVGEGVQKGRLRREIGASISRL